MTRNVSFGMLGWRFHSVAVSSGDVIDETISPNKNNASGVNSIIFKHLLMIFVEKIPTMRNF